MINTHLMRSRYLTKARAAYAARLLVAGAVIVVPTACGSSDDEAFSQTTPSTTAAAAAAAEATTPSTSPATAAPTAADPAPTPAPTAGSATTVPSAATEATGTAVPDGSVLAIDFTYAVTDSGGRVHNPYLAAWVEDADGNLVQTIAVWYQSGKGDKWLPDLSSWYTASDGTDVTTSGATRAPGTYSLAWDGKDWQGGAAPAGTYTIFVEAAREKGPYSITSAEVVLDGNPVSATMPDNNELTGLAVSL